MGVPKIWSDCSRHSMAMLTPAQKPRGLARMTRIQRFREIEEVYDHPRLETRGCQPELITVCHDFASVRLAFPWRGGRQSRAGVTVIGHDFAGRAVGR